VRTRLQLLASSYRLRLALGYMVVVALVAGLWGWSLFGPITDAVIEQQQTHLQGVAQAAALVLGAPDVEITPAVAELVKGTDLRMTVVAADGAVLADSAEDPGSMENHSGRPEIRMALEGSVGRDIRESATQGIEQMYVAVPARYARERVALRVSESLERIGEIGAQTRRTGLALLGVALVLALIVGLRIATLAARPIERLAQSATTMASGDLGVSVPAESGALAPLASALSTLRTQLRERLGALETERTNLHTVVDGLADAILLLDGEQISVSNRAASDLLALPVNGVAGRSLADSGLPASLIAAIRDRLNPTRAGSTEVGPDPRGRSLRLTIAPLDRSGAERTLVIISDITDRTRVERMRRDFVANASHELKTPTAAILLLAESAENAAADDDEAQALAFVGQIGQEAARLRQLVIDLLDLSRLETPIVQGAVTDLREAVDLSLSAHSRAASTKGLDLKADFSAVENEDVFAAADRTDIAIALDNLLANAIAYTDSGEVRVVVDATGDIVKLVVSDTGMGIPTEDLQRVFERFYRVDRSRVRDSGGTGLGLSLVRHAVERAGGKVSIESATGEGTRATITLPRAR